MDGSDIHNILYNNISMTGVTTPLYMYIGARLKRG